MRKKLALFLVFIFIFAGCSTPEEVPEAMVSLEKADYAAEMDFSFRIVIGSETHIVSGFSPIVFIRIRPEFEQFNPFYDELVFVHSEAEAEGFPDNVIVAWPSEVTMHVPEGFQWAVGRSEDDLLLNDRSQRDPITFENFGFSAPITVVDMVDNWEQVNAFWQSLTMNEQSTIQGIAGGAVRAAETEE